LFKECVYEKKGIPMRELTPNEQMDMQATILYHLSLCMDDDTAIKIADSVNSNGTTLMDAVIEDIKTASDWENSGNYNDDDVRLAIGRVVAKRISAEV
jgi:hypothetical protein